jgi:sterol desaturase/sphingolipid hydroxylase (fatty acid hydroxylase superfamily)
MSATPMKDFVRNTRGRMFESDFFEFFSKVHPAAPFLLWVPIAIAIPTWAIWSGTTTLPVLAVMAPLGFVTWQVTEYFAHKKLFHWLGVGPISRRFHDIVHGFHHTYPDDPDRLVMPLAVSISLATLVAGLLWLVQAPAFTVPWFTGFLSGYLFYDFMHWSTHFRKPRTEWERTMRAHHMAHHFAEPELNFGISNRWVDRLLGTLRVRTATERKQDDNGSITPAGR